MHRRYAVFDFDGVLRIPGSNEPNALAVAVAESLVREGAVLVLVSYRSQKDRDLVNGFLSYIGVPRKAWGHIMLRPEGFEGGEIEWKSMAYKRLSERGIKAWVVNEDNPEVLEIARSLWPGACLFLYDEQGVPRVYGGPRGCLTLYNRVVHGVEGGW